MVEGEEVTIEILDAQITDLVIRVNRLEKMMKLVAEYSELGELRRITDEKLTKELYKFNRLVD